MRQDTTAKSGLDSIREAQNSAFDLKIAKFASIKVEH